jgi:ribosomal subunit interface protein
MRIEIRGRDFELTDALRNFTEKRLEVGLDRFRDRIEMIEASLADLNGPRGGIDKQCRLRAHFAGGGDVIARAADADSYAAIVRAVHRLGDRVTRMLAPRQARHAAWEWR